MIREEGRREGKREERGRLLRACLFTLLLPKSSPLSPPFFLLLFLFIHLTPNPSSFSFLPWREQDGILLPFFFFILFLPILPLHHHPPSPSSQAPLSPVVVVVVLHIFLPLTFGSHHYHERSILCPYISSLPVTFTISSTITILLTTKRFLSLSIPFYFHPHNHYHYPTYYPRHFPSLPVFTFTLTIIIKLTIRIVQS